MAQHLIVFQSIFNQVEHCLNGSAHFTRIVFAKSSLWRLLNNFRTAILISSMESNCMPLSLLTQETAIVTCRQIRTVEGMQENCDDIPFHVLSGKLARGRVPGAHCPFAKSTSLENPFFFRLWVAVTLSRPSSSILNSLFDVQAQNSVRKKILILSIFQKKELKTPEEVSQPVSFK